jgi:CRP/FNR family cyclic AMP-dependent transcriptional regulator
MKLDKLAQNPTIKKLLKECDKGDILFSEGSSANTVLLVLSGSLQLSRKRNGQVSILAVVGVGGFIGEKALLQEQPFIRAATATALTSTILLELGAVHFAQLES